MQRASTSHLPMPLRSNCPCTAKRRISAHLLGGRARIRVKVRVRVRVRVRVGVGEGEGEGEGER